MKNTLLAALFICIMVCLISGQAGAADIKVGVIDTQKIISDSKAGKAAYLIFNKEKETMDAQLTAKQKELQTISDEITGSTNMTAAVYSEKTAKYNKAKKELERMKTERDEDLNVRYTELNKKLFTEIAEIVSDYCKKENFTIILEVTYVAAYDGAIDITDDIIQLYDATK